jgi:hypothetical protein
LAQFGMLEAANNSNGLLLQAEQHQHQQPQRLSVDSVLLRVQPAACGKQYWHWRYQRDVVKLDFAYAVMTLCRVAASAYACTAPRWCVALVLLSAMLQLSMIAWRRLQYINVRLGLVCLLRLSWMCFSWHALRGIHARAFHRSGLPFAQAAAAAAVPDQHQLLVPPAAADTAALAAAAGGAGRVPAGEVAVVFAAASWLANLALQPLLQPVPFVLQAPLQALEAALLLMQFHGVAFRHVEALPGLAAAMYRIHAVCEGMFHVGAGFVFLAPEVLAGCSPGDLRLVANFVVAYAGLVLPLFLLYKAELLGKARFVLSCAAGSTGPQRGADAADSSTSEAARQAAVVSGSSRAAAATSPADTAQAATRSNEQMPAAGNGGHGSAATSGGGSGVPQLQLVGCVQPINREYLLEMLRSPSLRLKDDVICGVLLLLVTWGLCVWATPRLL